MLGDTILNSRISDLSSLVVILHAFVNSQRNELAFLSISNTGISTVYILATVHFLYSKPGCFSDMEYYFYQLAYRDSKGFKSPQVLRKTISNVVFLSFNCSWANKTTPGIPPLTFFVLDNQNKGQPKNYQLFKPFSRAYL